MNYHLLKENGEWQLRAEGANAPVFSSATKNEALQRMSDYMESRNGSVAVHRADGEIQEHLRYSHENQGRQLGQLSTTAWSIIGVAAVAAITAASVVYYYRDSIRDTIPLDRIKLPR